MCSSDLFQLAHCVEEAAFPVPVTGANGDERMATEWQFFALAALVGIVQGGSQALSRSLFARMIPKHKSSEYFGFFSTFEKFAGIAGPAMFAASVTLFGSSRAAVLSVIAFFIAGGIVLTRVDVEQGEREAALGSELT